MGSPFRSALIYASRSSRIEHLVRDRSITQPLVQRFIAGDTVSDAIEATQRLKRDGINVTLDRLGEGVSDESAVREVVEGYRADFMVAPRGSQFSVKLSQLGLRISPILAIQALSVLIDDIKQYEHRLHIDMEESQTVKATMEVLEAVYGRDGDLGIVVQAMLYDAMAIMRWGIERDLRIRLVKGAYKEPSSVAYQGKEPIRRAYLKLLGPLMSEGRSPAIGTHDDVLIDATREIAAQFKKTYEVQSLYGVREDLARRIAATGTPVRVYTPYGNSWYPYFMRRLAERPQNVGFALRQVVDRAGAH